VQEALRLLAANRVPRVTEPPPVRAQAEGLRQSSKFRGSRFARPPARTSNLGEAKMATETDLSVDLAREFVARSRFYLSEEYRTKIRRAVTAIPADVLWQRANDQSNSVGNLLVHLEGNVRQWIVSGVGGAPDTRDRAAEFGARAGAGADELLARLDMALTEAARLIAR
jgi:hypothetical protein